MTKPEPTIRVNVDLTNPGQFFACCGLLELADRLWNGAEGAFTDSGTRFTIFRTNQANNENTSSELISAIASCPITSTMSENQVILLKKLMNKKKNTFTNEKMIQKDTLSALWKKEQIRLNEPFNISIDWWEDQFAGGDKFKTWAGKQFVLDIVKGMQKALRCESWNTIPPDEWLNIQTNDGNLPLYFDSNIGGQSSSLDVGFSLDSLDMRYQTRPLIEFAAFVGMQRFRPYSNPHNGSYFYIAWTQPLSPLLASIACCGMMPHSYTNKYEFQLLYRTKYLKSLLPSITKGFQPSRPLN